MPKLRHVVPMRDCPPIDDPLVLSWAAFCDRAAAVTDAELDAGSTPRAGRSWRR
jgi:hypothetical protein